MAQDDSVVVISSSPEFPSIHQLLAKSPKRTTLRSGKNAAAIPDNAPSSFMTATNLWKSLHPGQELVDDEPIDVSAKDMVSKADGIPEPVDPGSKASESDEKKPRKKRATGTTAKKSKKSGEGEAEPPPPQPLVDAVTAESKPAPKRRGRPKGATEQQKEAQTTIPKGKVTKAAPKEKKTRKKAETVSRHFANPAPSTVPAEPATSKLDDEPIDQEQAIRRRLDWTPPPEKITINLEDSVLSQEPELQDSFKNLLGGYNDKMDDGQINASTIAGPSNNDILGKRKLIELVATKTSKTTTPETSQAKSKAPKKKPRTITDLAMAAYRPVEENEDLAPTEKARKESVLNYFEVEGPGKETGKGAGGASKTAKKPAKAKASKKKAEPKKQILLSPASALKQVSGQDFVFGTASQLATEDDPDLFRALHEAMKESNHPDRDPFASSSPIQSEIARRRKAGGKLWTAGARDDDGDLLDLEPLDLTGSPVAASDYPLPQLSVLDTEKAVAGQASAPKIPIEILSSDFDSFDLTESPALPTAPKALLFAAPTAATGAGKSAASKVHTPPIPAESVQVHLTVDSDFEPPPSNQEHHRLIAQSQAQASPERPQASMPQRPKYELYTDAKLAKEISAYGFKPVKKREAMIALLEKCWDNKQKATLLDSATDDATSKTKTAAKPKGRPRKTTKPAAASTESTSVPTVTTPKRTKAATASRAVVEIADSDASDSEDPFFSSPVSARAKEDVFSDDAHEAMDVSVSDDTEDASLLAMEGPSTEQTVLFSRITKAVTTAPRTRNPAEPSWYEKMLMYDPVILEDLTAWLNAGQLDRVGHDGEVNPEEVKLWCLSKSVCCLWRQNIHGKARKRF
ncbi:hypothetical protein QBC37DRAFT_428442 [Rhypophila decipiens]|uniref:Structure-specific endonuclease subunit SLX4 n=1 Tax=Rhypophila decipiens TaxID=261697 RepID=A0AAN6Y1U9_9PEZI|nr:hypothetical protein QBC37DRAFT_428442 [Rhypophila decipiens]